MAILQYGTRHINIGQGQLRRQSALYLELRQLPNPNQ
jgi:hypothetical protein